MEEKLFSHSVSIIKKAVVLQSLCYRRKLLSHRFSVPEESCCPQSLY
jgi:hypothetical protein